MAGGEIMSDLRKAAERMMHALAEGDTRSYSPKIKESEIYLAYALEQPQQEPVAEVVIWEHSKQYENSKQVNWLIDPVTILSGTKLYTSPQNVRRLSDDEIFKVYETVHNYDSIYTTANKIMDACGIPKEVSDD